MGIAKKTDGRYVVGKGIADANDYKGSAAWRDMVIQLTESGATEKSEEYLNFLKDYALNANSLGEPIMPPSVDVWISNHGTTTAVEADDVAIDGANYTICGIKWDGSAWDYTNAGQGSGGGGGSSLPSYTSADKGKFLGLGEAAPVTNVIIPEQSISLTLVDSGVANCSLSNVDFSSLSAGDTVTVTMNYGDPIDCVFDGEELFADLDRIQITITSNSLEIEGNVGAVSSYVANATSISASVSITPTTTEVIVPQQTAAISGGQPAFLLNVTGTVENGDNCVLTINGTDYSATAEDDGHDGIQIVASSAGAALGFSKGVCYFAASADGTYTISLTRSAPSVEPKWEAALPDYSNAEEGATLKIVHGVPTWTTT